MNTAEYNCLYCFKKFESKTQLNSHISEFQPLIKDPCVVCNKNIHDCISRKHHLDSHPMCMKCKIHFKRDEFLSSHKIVHHASEIPEDLFYADDEGHYICYICEQPFSDSLLAQAHVTSRHLILKTILLYY